MKKYIYRLYKYLKSLNKYPQLILKETSYDDYWINKRGQNLGYANSFQVFRANYIANKIEDKNSILDIGCGDGGVLLEIKKSKNVDATGADISDIVLNFLNEKNISTLKFDINKFDQIDSLPNFDHILLLEVLEHMQNPEKFLQEIKPKANKSIFFSFPNSGYIAHRFRLLMGRFPIQWRTHPGEHIRFWTYRDAIWWLNELDLFENYEVETYEGIPILNKLWKNLFAAAIIVKASVK